MKKIVTSVFFVLALILASCGGKKQNDNDKITKEIAEYKKQVSEINSKIKSLEALLTLDSTSSKYLIPVIVKEVSPTKFEHFIEISGSVEAENDAMISPETGGQIKKILVKDGDKVSKGQLLVVLNTDVYESSINEVKTGLELASKLFDKQKSLFDQGVGSEIQYLQVKNSKESLEAKLKTLETQMEMSRIHAPFSGIVEEVYKKEGELASPGFSLMHLVELSQLKVLADVSEKYLSAISQEMNIIVTIPSFPDMKMNAKITRTGSVIAKENRTFKVEAKLSNPGNKLKPNMIAILSIKDFEQDSALIVPSIIIKKDIAKRGISDQFLFIAKKDSTGVYQAQKVYVVPGKSAQNNTMVIEGLTPNDKVIVEGYNTVSTGSAIEIK